MTISVITITYNAAQVLPFTLASVAQQRQHYPQLQHVLIDGGSTDGTVDLIRDYAAQHPDVVWVSEKDRGLYHAMNKGIERSTGEWLNFMNAGDTFYAPDTVAQALTRATADTDVLYGRTLMIAPDGTELGDRSYKKLPHALHWRHLKWGMVVSHQALLVRRRVCQHYDLQYSCAADIDWAIRTLGEAKSVKNTGIFIDRFLEGGLSHSRRKKCLRERWYIICRHYGLLCATYVHFVIVLKYIGRGFRFR